MFETIFQKLKKSFTGKVKSKVKSKKNYPNRFLKFYYLHQDRLNEERRASYKDRKKNSICVRCQQKALSKIVFCKYHQQKQKEYNRQARVKR